MGDIKDILGLSSPKEKSSFPRMGLKSSTPPPMDKRKRRLTGLGRELIQLTHDIQNNNAMQDVAVHDNLELRFKDKIRIEKKVSKWHIQPFYSSSRSDSTPFYHWSKRKDEEDMFSKFNKRPLPFSFEVCSKFIKEAYSKENPIEESLNLTLHPSLPPVKDPSWNCEDSILLLELYFRFNGRFYVVHDRWTQHSNKDYPMEALLERLYVIVKNMYMNKKDVKEISKSAKENIPRKIDQSDDSVPNNDLNFRDSSEMKRIKSHETVDLELEDFKEDRIVPNVSNVSNASKQWLSFEYDMHKDMERKRQYAALLNQDATDNRIQEESSLLVEFGKIHASFQRHTRESQKMTKTIQKQQQSWMTEQMKKIKKKEEALTKKKKNIKKKESFNAVKLSMSSTNLVASSQSQKYQTQIQNAFLELGIDPRPRSNPFVSIHLQELKADMILLFEIQKLVAEKEYQLTVLRKYKEKIQEHKNEKQ